MDFVIIVDTNEKASYGGRPLKRYWDRVNSFTRPHERRHMKLGDYTAEVDGKVLEDVFIERKKDIEEIGNCLTKDFWRFNKELALAKQSGVRKIYLLIENVDYQKFLNGDAWKEAEISWMYKDGQAVDVWYGLLAEYNICPVFCKQEDAGRVIEKILEQEVKIYKANKQAEENLTEQKRPNAAGTGRARVEIKVDNSQAFEFMMTF